MNRMKHQITLWTLVWMVSMSATAQNVTDEMDPGKFEVDGVFYTLDGFGRLKKLPYLCMQSYPEGKLYK